MFLIGNFFNVFDRDGLYGSLLNFMFLFVSDKIRLELFGFSVFDDIAF